MFRGCGTNATKPCKQTPPPTAVPCGIKLSAELSHPKNSTLLLNIISCKNHIYANQRSVWIKQPNMLLPAISSLYWSPPLAPIPSPAVSKHFVRLKQRAFKLDRSTTVFGIPLPLMKEFAIEQAKPFFNASLQSKILNDWRKAYAPPVPRVGNIQHPSPTCDPSPALSSQPRLRELCGAKGVRWLGTKLDPHQLGNIRSRSASHGLISFLDHICQSLEKRGICLHNCRPQWALSPLGG